MNQGLTGHCSFFRQIKDILQWAGNVEKNKHGMTGEISRIIWHVPPIDKFANFLVTANESRLVRTDFKDHTMTTSRVLMVGAVHWAKKQLEELEEKYQVEHMTVNTREEFYANCATKYQGIKAIYRNWDSTSRVVGDFDADLIRHLPDSVRFISNIGVGYDSIAIDVCTERRIYVSNTPGVVDDATADINVLLILAACRNAYQFMTSLRAGNWRGDNIRYGIDPEGKTLGILGMGRIGRAVAQRMLGFRVKIQYYNRTRLDSEVESLYNAAYVDLPSLLSTSDIISINVPLTSDTHRLIGAKELEMMKDGVVIVNTARGKVIDEEALVEALESGKVWACGLDVFEKEPQVHPRLISNPHAILLPHIGTETVETAMEMEAATLRNVDHVLSTGRFVTPVPEHQGYF